MDDYYINKGLQNQDRIVFDFVFTYYYSGLCAFVNQYVNDKDVAEELVQDFFVRFWVDCPNLEIKVSLKAYFFASVKNDALDYIKHQAVKKRYKDYILQNSPIVFEEDAYAEKELMGIITNGLLKLQPRCSEIFVLSRFKGKSNKEISKVFKISQRTVEIQISNALKLLKKELATP